MLKRNACCEQFSQILLYIRMCNKYLNLVIKITCISGERKYKEEHCIKMTPEKHKEIQTFVEKVTAFLETLADEHEEFDIRQVNIDIEGHSDDEEEEKETVLQVTINDCATVAEKEAEEDREELKYREEVKKEQEEEEIKAKDIEERQKERSEQNEVDKKKIEECNSINQTSQQIQDNNSVQNEEHSNYHTGATNETSESKTNDSHYATQKQKEISESCGHESKPRAKPKLVYLNLSENGQEILDILEKKRGKKPILVILEQGNCTRRIFMPSLK